VDAYILFDQSSSMSEPVAAPATGTRWTVAAAGFTAFVKDPAAAGIGVGLQYFPLNGVAPNSCNAPYSTPEVPIAPLPGNANTLATSMAAHAPTTFTPTGPALAGAIAHMKEWAASHPGRAPVVVLTTDGFPTECEPQQIADIAVLAKNAFETAPSVRTAVVALNVGPGKENFSQIAKAGGTSSALFVDTDSSSAFAAALLTATRRTLVTSCDLPLPGAPGEPLDFTKISVSYSAGTQPGRLLYGRSSGDCTTNGGDVWYYDNPSRPTKIMLCSRACEERASRTYHVEVGCEGTGTGI
jgi:hypothetical protein